MGLLPPLFWVDVWHAAKDAVHSWPHYMPRLYITLYTYMVMSGTSGHQFGVLYFDTWRIEMSKLINTIEPDSLIQENKQRSREIININLFTLNIWLYGESYFTWFHIHVSIIETQWLKSCPVLNSIWFIIQPLRLKIQHDCRLIELVRVRQAKILDLARISKCRRKILNK